MKLTVSGLGLPQRSACRNQAGKHSERLKVYLKGTVIEEKPVIGTRAVYDLSPQVKFPS